MQLVTDKKLEALIKHSLDRHTCGIYTRSTWWKVCQCSAKPYHSCVSTVLSVSTQYSVILSVSTLRSRILPLIVLHPITRFTQACCQLDNFGRAKANIGGAHIFSFNLKIMWFVTPILLFCLLLPTAV